MLPDTSQMYSVETVDDVHEYQLIKVETQSHGCVGLSLEHV